MPVQESRGNFIEGRFTGQAAMQTADAWLQSENPATDFDPVLRAPVVLRDVDAALDAARHAQRAWHAAGQEARLEAMGRLKAAFDARVEEMARAIVWETGKPHREALTEARSLGARIDLMAKDGLARIAPLRPAGVAGEARAHPQGVLAVLGPYNFPAHLLNAHVVPALMTGNTLVVKPSEHCPLVGQVYASAVADAGLPPGVFNLVQGAGSVGQALVAHAGTDGILFTGSSRTGRAITQSCLDAPGKILALELGGKNAAVILDDANLHQALAAVLQGAFWTTGQRCTATSRVLVHRSVYRVFVEALVDAVRTLRPGDPWQTDTVFGPLANRPAFERFCALRTHAQTLDLVTLLPGEVLPGGAFVTPSLHALPEGVTAAPGYLDEELFGPDLCIERIEDDDHAIARLAANPFGLANAVFTRSTERFERFFRDTRSGVLNHNRSTNGASGQLPFGGVGQSGNQRPAGIDAMRYTTYPVAILRAGPDEVQLEPEFRGALSAGAPALRSDVTELARFHRIEALLERHRIYTDGTRAAALRLSLAGLQRLRFAGRPIDEPALAALFGPDVRLAGDEVRVPLPDDAAADAFEARLAAGLARIAAENPLAVTGQERPGVSVPEEGTLPRSAAFLSRMYEGDFVPRERKTPVIDLSRSQGAYLRSVDEEPLTLLDAGSQIATLGLGFQPGAFLRGLDEGSLVPHLLANRDPRSHEEAAALERAYADFLRAQAGPSFASVSFTAGGAEANEKAFDLCRLHGPGGRRVLAFEGSFHGRTLVALQATFNPQKRLPFAMAGYEATFLPFPAWQDPREEPPVDDAWIAAWTRGETPAGGGDALWRAEVASLCALRAEIDRGDVCALIVEPMQGEGGDNYATARFFQGLRALTRGRGVPLIFDEVQMGFGLGGPFFWWQHFGLRDAEGKPEAPECITLAKKAQLGVCLSRFVDPRPSPGHVAQMWRGLAHAEGILAHRPTAMEARVREALWNLALAHPLLVSHPRQQGWAFAFDLPSEHLANQVLQQRFYRGYMAYLAGERTLRFRLHPAFTPGDVDALFAALHASLDAMVAWASEQAEGARQEGAPDAAKRGLQEALAHYRAPAWHAPARADGSPATTRAPAAGRLRAEEYRRLAEHPLAWCRWLLALPRGPLERACDRAARLEPRAADETLAAAARALLGHDAPGLGASAFVARLRAVLEELLRAPDPDATYAHLTQELGMPPARMLVEWLAARVRRVEASEWERYRPEVLAIERATYEEGRRDSEEDLREMWQGEDAIALLLVRRGEYGERVIGYALGGPVERYDADGPRHDERRGLGDTFYSSNITVAPGERGGGLGLSLKRAQWDAVRAACDEQGAPRYRFMTGRNRVGHTREMGDINRAFGAYDVHWFRGDQYGDQSGEALYYRIPLRRPHVAYTAPAQDDALLDWSDGIGAPLGARPAALLEALARGDFTDAVGTKLTLSNFVTPGLVRYTELLRALAPRGLPHAYFTSGRDELVDKGLRALRVRRPQGQVLLGLSDQFVGQTSAAARSLTDPAGQAQPFGYFDWPLAPHPMRAGVDASIAALRQHVLACGPSSVLGIVVEWLGEQSGFSIPAAYWDALARLRDETGVPLVVVETASALGRANGHVFASDALPFRPNHVWWYAGAQLGHIFVDDTHYVEKPLTLISTWDGDELSAIRAYHHLLHAHTQRADEGRARFEAHVAALPGIERSGEGLLWSLALGAHADGVYEAAKSAGLLLKRGFPGRLLLVPPLALDDAEMAEGFSRLAHALKKAGCHE